MPEENKQIYSFLCDFFSFMPGKGPRQIATVNTQQVYIDILDTFCFPYTFDDDEVFFSRMIHDFVTEKKVLKLFFKKKHMQSMTQPVNSLDLKPF